MNTGFRPVKWRKPVILSHCKTNMPGNFILRFSLIGLVFMGWSMTGMGNDGKPHPHFHLNRDMVRFFKDSLPDSKKETVENADTKKTELIKEVPKSRKQVKPIAVP